MEISVKTLLEIVIVVATLKLIVSRWQPPIQESVQAILCIGIGTIIGTIFYPTKEGFITAVIGSGFAFYGKDLITQFRTLKDDLAQGVEDGTISNKNLKLK